MKTRFLHCADIHLGYQQYNDKERFNDFGRALFAIVDKALGKPTAFDPKIQGKVDFVILAGDLFQKRAIDALTLNQAIRALERLRNAGIPCIAVEGNHERAYHEDTIGWMKFLALQDLLILLDAEFVDGVPQLQPWDPKRRQGSYIDIVPGVRVHGLRYFGSGTALAVQAYGAALAELPVAGIDYNLFIAHGGVEGQLADKAGGLSTRQWSALRPTVDYLALGHFHLPFQIEEWIFNPGSPENCSIAEAEWRQRGYLMVDVDTDLPAKHTVVQGNNPRRAGRLYSFKTDQAASPAALMDSLRTFLHRKAAELRDDHAVRAGQELLPPVVELYLTGVLPFDRAALDLPAVEALVQEAFAPLMGMVKNLTQTADYLVAEDVTLTRSLLERRVLADLFARDVRYAEQNERWADTALALKQLALQGAAPTAIVEELAHQLAQIYTREHEAAVTTAAAVGIEATEPAEATARGDS
jgi:predicted phosphodiesterase